MVVSPRMYPFVDSKLGPRKIRVPEPNIYFFVNHVNSLNRGSLLDLDTLVTERGVIVRQDSLSPT